MVRQLAEDSQRQLDRSARLVRSLQALKKLGEPAAIPTIVHHLLDVEAAVAGEAAKTLKELLVRVPPSQLFALDQRMRSGAWWYFDSHITYGVQDGWSGLKDAFFTGSSEERSIFLRLASCHGSGRVRESAIWRLDRESNSGEEIPFLLLRLSDWVPAVRDAAERAIVRRLEAPNYAAFWSVYPLVVRLGERTRAQDSPIFRRIQESLLKDRQAFLDAAMRTPDSWARHRGLSLAWAAAREEGESAQRTVIERMLGCREPAVRCQAAYWLAAGGTPAELVRRFLHMLLRDRLPAVRRVALGWCAVREPGAHVAELRAGLMDPSGIVRAIAQYYIPKFEPIDLRSFYRQASESQDIRVLRTALSGMVEIGRAEDAELIIPYFENKSVALRGMALLAATKFAAEKHMDLILRALQDGSPRVSRQACMFLDTHMHLIDEAFLVEVFRKTTLPHVRRLVLSLFNRLPKWQKLPLLIEVHGEEHGALKSMAANYLHSWLRNFNRTHVSQPSARDVQRCRAAMAAYGARLTDGISKELRGLLDSLG